MTKTTAPPSFTPEQRMKALKKANRIRAQKAELKRKLKAREVKASELLDSRHTQALDAFRTSEFLAALPGMGRTKTNRALIRLEISGSRRIGGLAKTQMSRLIGWLEQREEGT